MKSFRVVRFLDNMAGTILVCSVNRSESTKDRVGLYLVPTSTSLVHNNTKFCLAATR